MMSGFRGLRSLDRAVRIETLTNTFIIRVQCTVPGVRCAGYLGLLLAAVAWPTAALGDQLNDPLRFFEGSTEALTTMRVVMQKPFTSHSIGHGRINSDGSLQFVQHVSEQGRRAFDRMWTIHEIRPGQFTGTMSEALGPIRIEQIGNRYRFRFRLKNNLSAEQWLTPKGATIARTELTIRKFGIAVAHSEGWIRKVE